jgi:hypothetical protein
MNKHFYSFLTVAMTLWALTVPAVSATAADENTLVISDFTAQAGTVVDLSVSMNNTAEIVSFQFELELPEGVSIVFDENEGDYAINLSTSRTTLKKHTLSYGYQEDGCMKVVCFSSSNEIFSGNTGEVITIQLSLSASMKEGTYSIRLKNMELAQNDMVNHRPSDVSATLTVGEDTPVYDEGYSLSLTPFAIPSAALKAQSVTVSLAMETAVKIHGVSFEMYWNPSAPLYKKSGAYQIFYDTDSYQPADEDVNYVNVDDLGYTHGAQFSFTDDTGLSFATHYGSLLLMTFRAPLQATDGVYTVALKNIVFTDAEGNEYHAAPYAANIFLGDDPKAEIMDGTVTFCGNYSNPHVFALLENAIPTGSFTMLDLAKVTALPASTTFTLSNPNTLIRTASNLGLTQDNVVVGNVCESLVLTDGHPFHNTKTFTATSASYSRTMPNTYGTIYLPFAPDTEEYVFLAPTGVDATALTFDEVPAPQPNTPYLYRAKGTGAGAIAATNVTIPVSTAQTITSGNLTMKGTFTKEEFTTADNVYFIKDDTFYRFASSGADDKLTMNPFRAYFVNESGAPLYSIRERNGDTTLIDNATMEEIPMEIHDLQGRRVTEPTSSGIYIVNGKKMWIK